MVKTAVEHRRAAPHIVAGVLPAMLLLAACTSPEPASSSGADPAGSTAEANVIELGMPFPDTVPTTKRQSVLLDASHSEWSRPSPPVWHARFETSKGDFITAVVREHGPHGADRFYNLVRLGYYDDTRFHRVNPNYIVQWGLHGDPAVNAVWQAHPIPDDPKYGSNVRGSFAFAHAPVPENRTTQIYINIGDNTRNDGEPFAIFGQVVEGMDVVDQLYSGYGESSGSGVRQGRQGDIIERGNAYLDQEWPLLDSTIRARVIRYEAR